MAKRGGFLWFNSLCGFAVLAVARYWFDAPLLLASFLGVVGYYAVAPGLLLLGMKVSEFFIKRSPAGAALIEEHKAEQAAAWKELDAIKEREAAGEHVDPVAKSRVEGILFRDEGVIRRRTSPITQAWEVMLAASSEAGVSSELAPVITEVLMPMGVNPQCFFDNLAYLSVGGRDVLLARPLSDEPAPKPNPTPSIAACPRRAEWPMGHPQWFIAAFPDVSKWASKTLSDAEFERDPKAVEDVKLYYEKIEQLLERAGVREADSEEAFKKIMFDSQGKTSPKFGRLLVEWYVEATGCRLETSTP